MGGGSFSLAACSATCRYSNSLNPLFCRCVWSREFSCWSAVHVSLSSQGALRFSKEVLYRVTSINREGNGMNEERFACFTRLLFVYLLFVQIPLFSGLWKGQKVEVSWPFGHRSGRGHTFLGVSLGWSLMYAPSTSKHQYSNHSAIRIPKEGRLVTSNWKGKRKKRERKTKTKKQKPKTEDSPVNVLRKWCIGVAGEPMNWRIIGFLF